MEFMEKLLKLNLNNIIGHLMYMRTALDNKTQLDQQLFFSMVVDQTRLLFFN
jgi:hypothetical protein